MNTKPINTACSQCPAQEKSVFKDLDPEEIGILKQAKSCNHYVRHQVVFSEGNTPLALYCLQKGVVKLSRSLVPGRHQIVHLAGAGELLGYRTILKGGTYTATAETVEECDICAIDKEVFFEILKRNPRSVLHFLNYLCSEIRRTEISVCTMVQKSVRERMAECLLLLKEAHGTPTDHGIKLDLNLFRQEIADLVGTRMESAVRFLREFKNDGFIEIEGTSITLVDIHGLLKTAGISR